MMKYLGYFIGLGITLVSALVIFTYFSIQSPVESFQSAVSRVQDTQVLDRTGIPLSITYQTRWNYSDSKSLHEIPDFLKYAFLVSEDKRFYQHQGVDWSARLSALKSNLIFMRNLRGASTITEQIVRMLKPRKRTLWARWVEGFEANILEKASNKNALFEFYLNQVPYAGHRRGVAQGARYYFGRDLETLTRKEMLALVVLVRAPSNYDLYKYPHKTEGAIFRLAQNMAENGFIEKQEINKIKLEKLTLNQGELSVDARHFARFVKLNTTQDNDGQGFRTTLDAGLQEKVQRILDTRLNALQKRNVKNGAVICADYSTGEILAWVVGHNFNGQSESEIDATTTLRQPGSTLKPFLYAMALDKGWSAAKILDDSPLTEAVGVGLHRFRNYSNTNYGPLTLREALGNSLNIPALLAIRYVGAGDFLSILVKMGFKSLDKQSDFYDEGLALGNGEVSLLELAQGYAVLANRGVFKPLIIRFDQRVKAKYVSIFSEESASLIGNILSDPWARSMEFGQGSVLNLPVQTAIKTGTSTDFRDAWVVGYNDRYVVAVWMGNLDRSPMDEITGSKGPALVLRSVFDILNKNRETARLFLSPRLIEKKVCSRPKNKAGYCPQYSEWLFADRYDAKDTVISEMVVDDIELVRPTEGLQIAYDPRIKVDHQKFRFELRGLPQGSQVHWFLNDEKLAEGHNNFLLWPVVKGQHELYVQIQKPNGSEKNIGPVKFIVK